MGTSFSPFQVQPPADWQAFERLCHALWQQIWQDPAAKLNGRPGDGQQGVDIFGRDRTRNSGWCGVQCKCKDVNIGRQLTEAELREELSKAAAFTPALDRLIVATTAPRNIRVQGVVRTLADETRLKGGPELDVWFWDDIVEELHRHPILLQDYLGHGFISHVYGISPAHPTVLDTALETTADWRALLFGFLFRKLALVDTILLHRRSFLLRSAHDAEMEFIQQKLSAYVDLAECPDLPMLTSFRNVSRDIFFVVEERDPKSRQSTGIVGCAIVYPLKKRRAERIASGFETADDIVEADIHRNRRTAAGYYIGFAWGNGRVAQGFLCGLLFERFARKLKKQTALIFARPTTKESLIFLINNGFISCSTESWKLNMNDICKINFPAGMKLRRGKIQRP